MLRLTDGRRRQPGDQGDEVHGREQQRRDRPQSGGLVIACHRPGLLPTLVECTTSVELLAALVRELYPDGAPVLADSLPGLYEKHSGDLRAALRELYDACAAP